jgi:NAD(P)H-hydrate repair Nnr-like enzyme with NAD(P)H-hydrate dehydratase domain
VLKGSGTVIAQANRAPVINPTGNAKLATGGTGDVLSGLIGARLAQGLNGFDAACHAAYQHGQVAEQWPQDQALTASQLAHALA